MNEKHWTTEVEWTWRDSFMFGSVCILVLILESKGTNSDELVSTMRTKIQRRLDALIDALVLNKPVNQIFAAVAAAGAKIGTVQTNPSEWLVVVDTPMQLWGYRNPATIRVTCSAITGDKTELSFEWSSDDDGNGMLCSPERATESLIKELIKELHGLTTSPVPETEKDIVERGSGQPLTLDKITKSLDGFSDPHLYVGNIPLKKLQAAVKVYGAGILPTEVLLLYDNTVFGGAKDGFFLTATSVHWHNQFCASKWLPYSLVTTVVCQDATFGSAKISLNSEDISLNMGNMKEIAAKVATLIRHYQVSVRVDSLKARLTQKYSLKKPSTKPPLLESHRAAEVVVTISWPGQAMLMDVKVTVSLGGQTKMGSFTKGFEHSFAVASGVHDLVVKIPVQGTKYTLDLRQPGKYRVQLRYSTTIGNFDKTCSIVRQASSPQPEMQQPRPPSSWHVVIQEETSGPYTGAQLKLLVRDGKLMPDHLVWRDGLKDWIPAKRVRGLFT